MGFGLLFIGYLFMFSFPYKGFDITPDVLGFIIAYFGVRKLAEYGCGFDNLKNYFRLIFPTSALTFVFQLIGLFGINISFLTLWNYCYSALLFVYNLLLLVAVYKIGDDTDMKSIKAKAKRNMYVGIFYYAILLFFDFPINYIQELKNYLTERYPFGVILFLVGYLWLILNLSTIFNCYMWICEPGDEEMPIKERNKTLEDKE